MSLLGLCAFLAMVPIEAERVEKTIADEVAVEDSREGRSFLDGLRESRQGPPVGTHWTSLLPPAIAIMIAAYFRSMVFALLSAFVAGAFLSYGMNPLVTFLLAFVDFVWLKMSYFSLYIFLFLFSLVGLVHVMSRSGGLAGLVLLLERFAKGPRRTKVVIGISGLLMFFDDYANTVVVGNTMRNLADKWRISREKLAYLVDSTTAPVAGLALLSTWIAFEAMLIGEQAEKAGIPMSGYSVIVEMLPFRFYCIGTLIFLFMSSGMGRDFGSMLKAETRSANTGQVRGEDSEPFGIQPTESMEPAEDTPKRWFNAFIPVLVVGFGSVFGILLLGYLRLKSAGQEFVFFDFASWQAAFGVAVYNPADPDGPGVMPVLFIASVLGGAVAIVMSLSQGLLTLRQTAGAYIRSMPTMWLAIFILIMTWSLGGICDNLGTGSYLIALLGDDLPLWALPLFTFIVSSAIAFATGTSFATMTIVTPVILPLAIEMGAYYQDGGIIFFLTTAAILDGAIFGDHCSPISDTTVLTSLSTNCDHIAHVNTQFPYAMLTMVLSGLTGYLAVAGGVPAWIFYILFPVAAYGALMLFGKRVVYPKLDT